MSREECLALHTHILALGKARILNDRDLMDALARMEAAGGHRALGYGSFGAYAASVLPLQARQARDLARVGAALPHLPPLERALTDGRLSWTKAREIVRVATPATVEAWVERAVGVTSRELEALVSQAGPDGAPPVEGTPAPARRTLVFHQIEAIDAEIIEQWVAVLRQQVGGDPVPDGVLLAAHARRELARRAEEQAGVGPLPASEPAVLHLRLHEDGAVVGYDAEVSDTVAAEARCDAKVVDADGHTTRTIPARIRERVLERDGRRCAVPGCEGRFWLHLHHLLPWSLGGGHEPWNLLTVCACHHRLVHEGTFRVEVDAMGAVHVERADGTTRVGPSNPLRRAPGGNRQGERAARPWPGPTHVGPCSGGHDACAAG